MSDSDIVPSQRYPAKEYTTGYIYWAKKSDKLTLEKIGRSKEIESFKERNKELEEQVKTLEARCKAENK